MWNYSHSAIFPASNAAANQTATRAITDTKLYVPVVNLPIQTHN